MNPIDDQLNRLFRAAKETDPAIIAPPYGWDTRMMAAWRVQANSGPGLWDMTLLARAVVVAIILMGISFLPVLNKTTQPDSDYLQLADSTLASDETP